MSIIQPPLRGDTRGNLNEKDKLYQSLSFLEAFVKIINELRQPHAT